MRIPESVHRYCNGCQREKANFVITILQPLHKWLHLEHPDAFDKFLTVDDASMLAAIKVDIDASKAAKQIIIDKKNEENYRAMTRGIVIPGKEANAENENEEDEFRSKENEEF